MRGFVTVRMGDDGATNGDDAVAVGTSNNRVRIPWCRPRHTAGVNTIY